VLRTPQVTSDMGALRDDEDSSARPVDLPHSRGLPFRTYTTAMPQPSRSLMPGWEHVIAPARHWHLPT
jgi:hypothetical protein